MKNFLYDFMVHNHLNIHLHKLKLCFQKCREYGINLDPYKCAFMTVWGMILGFVVFK